MLRQDDVSVSILRARKRSSDSIAIALTRRIETASSLADICVGIKLRMATLEQASEAGE